jgi:ribosomal protein S18 acetylase RimI-like enzyme
MSHTDPISLRPIASEDLPFLFEIYASTREEELSIIPWDASQKSAFLRMQFEAQDRSYRAQFPGASFDLILLAGRPVGRLLVDRREDEIRVIDISLHRDVRGVGIGGTLLGDLIAEARLASKPIRLHVDRANRAKGLYRRLGFRTIGEGDLYDLMEFPVDFVREDFGD